MITRLVPNSLSPLQGLLAAHLRTPADAMGYALTALRALEFGHFLRVAEELCRHLSGYESLWDFFAENGQSPEARSAARPKLRASAVGFAGLGRTARERSGWSPSR